MQKTYIGTLSKPLFGALTLLGLLLYIVTHFYRLASFPTFFFCDEAFVGVATRKLINDHFWNEQGIFLPLYWEKAPGRWVPQIFIYFALLPTLLWPRSVEALRAITGVIGLLTAGTAQFACMRALNWRRFGWLPLYLLSVIPVLFLHSRLAFETTQAIFFYLMMLSFYVCYIRLHPGYGIGVLISALALWYSHWSGTIVCSVCIALLLVSDIRLHLRRWRWTMGYGLLFLLAMTPLFVWYRQVPGGLDQQLSALHGGSNPFDAALLEPLRAGWHRYLAAIDPRYWFIAWNDGNQLRHLWRDRPLISQWCAIPLAIGLLGCIIRSRDSFYRALPLALLAGATPVFVVDSHIQRVFYLLAPFVLIVIYGIEVLVSIAQRLLRWARPSYVASCLALMLSTQGIIMLKEAIVDAPVWFRQYGLYGIPWGATQLYEDAIPSLLAQNPTIKLVPSSDWANGADIFPHFFLKPAFLERIVSPPFNILLPKVGQTIPQDYLFAMVKSERDRVTESGKFKPLQTILSIPYPDNSEGFTFSRLQYVDNIDTIITEERSRINQPIVEQMELWGRPATITYSRLDMGIISAIADGKKSTVARGLSANPFVIDITFTEPLLMRRLHGVFFPMDLEWEGEVFGVNGAEIGRARAGTPMVNYSTDTECELIFGDEPASVQRLRLSIRDTRFSADDDTHIHVRELIPEQ